MGHSAPTVVPGYQRTSTFREKIHTRLALLPEEVLYLTERGSLLCWKQEDPKQQLTTSAFDKEGTPMSVQQAYAELIGQESLTLERYQVRSNKNGCSYFTEMLYVFYQVYAYLKRLGYTVTRSQAPSDFYPAPQSDSTSTGTRSSLSTLLSGVTRLRWTSLCDLLRPSRRWWKPLNLGCLVHIWTSYCKPADASMSPS